MNRYAPWWPLLAVIFFGIWSFAPARDDRASGRTPPAPPTQLESDEDEPSEPTEATSDDQAAMADKEAEEESDEPSAKDDQAAKDKAEATDSEETDSKDTDSKKDSSATDDKSKEKDKSEAKDDSAKDKSASKSEKTDDKAAAKKEVKKRKTYKVKPKRLKVDVSLDGAFVARKMDEVALRPESWTDYEIVQVAELGAKVHQGEVLFKFDDRKLNETIAELELDQRISELSIRREEEELPRLEKTLAMSLDGAERNDREAKEDFQRFNEIDRPMTVKSIEFMVQYYQFQLDYEQDELNELEKMYAADDLTEETEEIILKRQRKAVEFAKFSLERAKLNRNEMLEITLPRFDIQIKESLERSALALARAKMAMSLDLNRARYELEQRKQLRAKSLDRHAKLLGDRALMEIKSPADGVLYYGQCVGGRWGETATLLNKFKPHNNVSPNSILATIVDPRPLYVTANIDEAKRPDVAEKQQAKIATPLEGSDRITGHVQSISPIPVSTGKFEINLDIDQDQIPDWVVAGISCKIKVNTYDKADAIVVPKTALHTDEQNEDQQYVWLVDPDDTDAKPERHDVKAGKRSGDDIEVLKGLKAGQVVSLDDEDAKEKEKAKED